MSDTSRRTDTRKGACLIRMERSFALCSVHWAPQVNSRRQRDGRGGSTGVQGPIKKLGGGGAKLEGQ